MNNLEETIKMTKNLNLLYVEDDVIARESLISFLEDFFNNIIIAIDGEDGLIKLNKNKIDIIITDLSMPKLNGLEMIKKIKEVNDSIPIIILTAHNKTIFFIESVKLEVDAYLLKPIDLNKFISILNKISKIIYLKKQNEKCIKIVNEYSKVIKEIKELAQNNPDELINYIKSNFNKKDE